MEYIFFIYISGSSLNLFLEKKFPQQRDACGTSNGNISQNAGWGQEPCFAAPPNYLLLLFFSKNAYLFLKFAEDIGSPCPPDLLSTLRARSFHLTLVHILKSTDERERAIVQPYEVDTLNFNLKNNFFSTKLSSIYLYFLYVPLSV